MDGKVDEMKRRGSLFLRSFRDATGLFFKRVALGTNVPKVLRDGIE